VKTKLLEKLKKAFNKKTADLEHEEENLPGEEDGLPGEGRKISRRAMLKFFGIQAAAGSMAVGMAIAAPKNFKPEHYNRGITPEQLPNSHAWLTVDPSQCVGCRTCEIICSLTHDGECNPALSRIKTTYDPFKTLSLIGVMPDVCRQCNMADCYLACEHDALVIDQKTGARKIDPDKCVGCGECMEACPWNMIIYNEISETYTKCDLCDGDPQCVKFCPANAIKYVALK